MLKANRRRRGVVLLVVISLLMLFAIVGIAFVIYSQAQASTARIWKESEALRRPDMDPEELLSYFLGQFIYDTDNHDSALRGHSLARTMYGRPGSSIPFNGTGRIHTPGDDDYYNINYTRLGALVDPDQYGSPNPPYTYPDLNNVYLAAVRASDRAVLIPSYQRTSFGGDPNNRRHVLRPLPQDHAGFPPQADAGGDVKNLAESPGALIPNSNPPQYANNDSVWLDLGHPVMTGPDGRKFKPLFAPLIIDLDNRVNVNLHGNKYGTWNVIQGGGIGDRGKFWSTSEHGWAPWEVNPGKVIKGQEGPQEWEAEWRRLLLGNDQVAGRFDKNAWFYAVAGGSIHPPRDYWIVGKFYSMTDENCHICGKGNLSLPGCPPFPWFTGWYQTPGCPPTAAFPADHRGYGRDNFTGGGESPYPTLYNFFDPAGWNYFTAGVKDRRFGVGEMEALLRYSDKGSPAMTSDLFALCPRSFSDPVNGPKTRWMVTTHSFDVDRPGVMPMIWSPAAQPYRLAAGSQFPSSTAVSFPGTTLAAPPPNSEFTPAGQAASAAAGRIDLNRKLPAYSAGFATATRARQDLAREIFDVLRQVTGAADPATAAAGSPEFDALRWLAQLAANIVDFRDDDDAMTPFNWHGNEWVFGAELPRVVINEVYAEIANDPSDTGASASKPYDVNFWAELFNPFRRDQFGNLADGGAARLQDGAGKAIYQLVIAESPNGDLRKPNNVRGEPDNGKTKTVVAKWEAEPAPAPQPTAGVDVTLIRTIFNNISDAGTSGTNGSNLGYFVVGPKADFPGSDANRPQATLRVKSQPINGQQSSMSYQTPLSTDLTRLPKHTLLLRRLACVSQAHQPDPNQPNYNPYVTVDYVDDVATNDGVTKDQNGARQATQVDQRKSTGRNQPYAAAKGMHNDQSDPAKPLQNQPQHTFFKLNYKVVNPFDWLVWADRPLHNPLELLEVPAYKPHELTQQFMRNGIDPATGKPRLRFAHRAPWFNDSARVYRLLEFLRGGHRLQGATVNGRSLAKVNLNTIWDVEVLRALCDARPSDYFVEADVDAAFNRMQQLRNPDTVPGQRDRPFRSLALAHIDANDPYFRGGLSLEDTYFRSFQDPANPSRRLFQPATLPPYANENTILQHQMMTKLYQQVTTRSNVFAVFLTVGFFEVVNDNDSSRPPLLGPEIGAAEGRQVRHRMFAVVDRTCLTFDPANPARPGAEPFFLDALSAASAGNSTIRLPALSGNYEEWRFEIRPGDRLVVDVGPKQETITVTAANPATATITANFARGHEAMGIPVTNVGATTMLGHPGPQPRFDPRNPAYRPVVRYFSIIE